MQVENRLTHPRFADIYDRVVGPDFWSLWWPAFERTLAAHNVSFQSVADVACGTAETALRLAREGYTVYGTDISDEMIQVAKQKCAGTDVHLSVQDMTALDLPEPVDLLLCCYDSLNMVANPDALRACFAGFFAALAPGGNVICDLATRRHLEEDWGSGEIHVTVGNIDTVWHTLWDSDNAVSTIHLTATVPEGPDGLSVVTCRVIENGFPKQVIDQSILDAGFLICDVRDMIPWTPGTEDGQRLFYLLRKPDTK